MANNQTAQGAKKHKGEAPTRRLPHQKPGVSWRYHFGKLIERNYANKSRGGNSSTSFRTREYSEQTAFLMLGVLRFELGLKINKPQNFERKHAVALANWINTQYALEKKMPATLAGYATIVRHLFRWADKQWLVPIFDEQLNSEAMTRQLVTELDKTWEGSEVSFADAVERVHIEEPWVAMALIAQDAFGLRRREAIRLHPERDIDLDGGLIQIRVGAKGGRPRIIPIEHHWQHLAAEGLIQFVQKRNEETLSGPDAAQALAPADKTLLESIHRYKNVLSSLGFTRKELGVTGHGLRAGYVCRRLSELGVIPVIKGGDGAHEDAEQDAIVHRLVSESVGHSRKNVIGAYAGAAHVKERVRASDVMRSKGWLLPGRDPESFRENVKRLDAYLADAVEFEKKIDAHKTAHKQEGANHAH